MLLRSLISNIVEMWWGGSLGDVDHWLPQHCIVSGEEVEKLVRSTVKDVYNPGESLQYYTHKAIPKPSLSSYLSYIG
jgi:hypothetical protein